MNFAKGELLYVPLPRFILPELKETLVKFVRSCTKTFRHKLPTQTTIMSLKILIGLMGMFSVALKKYSTEFRLIATQKLKETCSQFGVSFLCDISNYCTLSNLLIESDIGRYR